MSDRNKLKEKIRQAISSEHSCKNNLCDLHDKRNYDRCICKSDAEAALTAIEEAGYVIMPEAPSGGVLIGKSLHHLNDEDVWTCPQGAPCPDPGQCPHPVMCGHEGAASAVWDEAVEACAKATCCYCHDGLPVFYDDENGWGHNHPTIKGEGVDCEAWVIRSLKRSPSPTEETPDV